MGYMLRRTSLLLVLVTLIALLAGIPAAAVDTGLQNVTFTCNDDTNFTATLDTAGVTALTDAVNGMTLFPAGDPPLSCSVVTAPVLLGTAATSSSTGLSYRPQVRKPPLRAGGSTRMRTKTRKLSSGDPQYDFAVGGGDQFFIQPSLAAPCMHNFGFSMRSLSNTTAGSGSYRETVPGGCAGFGETGQLMVNITCLQVTANGFNAHGTVTKATGQFVTGFPVFTTAYISGHDAGGAPADTLRVDANPGVNGACDGPLGEPATSHGRINVRDAG